MSTQYYVTTKGEKFGESIGNSIVTRVRVGDGRLTGACVYHQSVCECRCGCVCGCVGVVYV